MKTYSSGASPLIYKKIEDDKAIRAAANYVAGSGVVGRQFRQCFDDGPHVVDRYLFDQQVLKDWGTSFERFGLCRARRR